jgi:hypothetical protein
VIPPTEFGHDAVIRRNPDALSADVDGEIMLMGLEQGRLYGLDTVASAIWNRLAEPVEMRTLCAELSRRFDAAPETIESDVRQFLAAMVEQGFVQVGA